MAITVGTKLEISLVMGTSGGVGMNVYQYEVAVSPSVKTASAIAEAWWNHVKGVYRAIVVTGSGRAFDSVILRELNAPTGAYAEFSVPAGEQDGTRPSGELGSYMPAFTAAGMRLTVGSRLTRPGQKRFPFVTEGDVLNNSLTPAFVALIQNIGSTVSNDMTLGDPAEFVVLRPVVTRKDVSGAVIASQPVTGYAVNPYVTSQVSRKFGRGS